MNNQKEIICIALLPNGDVKLEKKYLKLDQYWLYLSGLNETDCRCLIKNDVRVSLGPMFIDSPYTFTMEYGDPKHEPECDYPVHVYTNTLLDEECGCGYEEHHPGHRGILYLLKHDPRIRKKFPDLDFSAPAIYKEVEERDTCVDCTETDITFIKNEIAKLHLRKQRRNMSWMDWIKSWF